MWSPSSSKVHGILENDVQLAQTKLVAIPLYQQAARATCLELSERPFFLLDAPAVHDAAPASLYAPRGDRNVEIIRFGTKMRTALNMPSIQQRAHLNIASYRQSPIGMDTL
jgi:hypothetical protein